MDNYFPKNYAEGEYFLYVYQYKRAYHIRVAPDMRSTEPHYWHSSRRRAYNKEECAALGLDYSFLMKYYAATRTYFHARMAINQNKPICSEISDSLSPEQRETIARVREYRLKEAKELKHRAWSDLAALRKRARAVLPSELPTIVFPSTRGLYS